MKTKRNLGVLVAALILVAAGLPFLYTPAKAEPEHVTFQVDVSVASGSFSADISASDGSIEPGGSITIDFSAEQGSGSLTVYLGTYGSQTISFNTPLSSMSIPVSGVSGVASVNVDLSGTLEGDLSVTEPGSLSTTHLSWNSWGKRSVTLDASNAEEGDTITITLTTEYTGHIGAHGETMLGDVTLISPQSLPGVQGSPSMTVTIDVKEKGGGGWGGIPGFGIIAAICGLTTVVALRRKLG